jgi:hypothetical protein
MLYPLTFLYCLCWHIGRSTFLVKVGDCIDPERIFFSSQEQNRFPVVNYIHTYRVARWFVFKPKIQNLGKFWRVLQWKMIVYFMDTRSILRSLVVFYGHLVYIGSWWLFGIFFPFWYFVPRKIWQPCKRRQNAAEKKVSDVM